MMFDLQSSMCDLVLEMSARVADMASVDYFVLFQTPHERKFGGNEQLCEIFTKELGQSEFDDQMNV
jgi:hypothetical protein